MKGIVYFIKSNSNNDIKIGYDTSESGMERFNTLKTAASRGLDFVGYIPTDNCPELERQMHEQFAEHRQEGEWFEVGIGIVCQEIVKHGGSFGYPTGQFVNTKPTKSFDPKALLNKRKFLKMLPKTFDYNDIDNFGTPYFYKNFNLTKQQAEKIIEENCTRFKEGRSYRIRKNKFFEFPVQIDEDHYITYEYKLQEFFEYFYFFLTGVDKRHKRFLNFDTYYFSLNSNHLSNFSDKLIDLKNYLHTYYEMFLLSLSLESINYLKEYIFSFRIEDNKIIYDYLDAIKYEKIMYDFQYAINLAYTISKKCEEIDTLSSWIEGSVFYDELLQRVKKARKVKQEITVIDNFMTNKFCFENKIEHSLKRQKIENFLEIFNFLDDFLKNKKNGQSYELRKFFEETTLSDFFIKNDYICERH